MNLVDLAEEGLTKQWWESRAEHHPKKGHSASSYLRCARQQVYDWIDAQPTNVVVKHIWAPTFGNLHHDLMYRLWKATGATVITEDDLAFEVRAPELEYPIRGRPDAVVISGEEKRMTDIKSVNPKAMHYGLPKEEHVAQISFYKRMVDECVINCPSIDTFSLLYLSRADFNRKECVMGVDFEEVDTTDLSNWITVEKCLKAQELPERIGEKEEYPCATIYKKTGEKSVWCEYYDLCWELHKLI